MNLVGGRAPDLSGLEKLRSLLRMGPQPNIGRTLKISPGRAEEGFADPSGRLLVSVASAHLAISP